MQSVVPCLTLCSVSYVSILSLLPVYNTAHCVCLLHSVVSLFLAENTAQRLRRLRLSSRPSGGQRWSSSGSGLPALPSGPRLPVSTLELLRLHPDITTWRYHHGRQRRWLFPRVREFWDNVRQIIPHLRFSFLCF